MVNTVIGSQLSAVGQQSPKSLAESRLPRADGSALADSRKPIADGFSVECKSFEVVYRHETPEQASKQPFFCVACECIQFDRLGRVLHDGRRQPELRYLHADDAGHAERKFRQAHTAEILQGIIHVVAVGPVIGYHVHDSHGEKLSA